MRWIIATTIVVILAVIGWFWYPRLVDQKLDSPYRLIDPSAWLIVEVHNEKDLALLTDSSAALASVDLLHQWPLPAEVEDDGMLILFAYSNGDGDGLGIITNESTIWLKDERFSESATIGGYTVLTTTPYTIVEAPSEDRLLPSRSPSPDQLRVYARPERLLQYYASNLSSDLLKMILQEGRSGMWVEFDVNDDNAVMQATGIADMGNKEAQHINDLHLLRFLPSNAGMAIVSSTKDLNYGLVHCSYGISTDPYEYLFVLYEDSVMDEQTANPAQNYQGIPITISTIPEQLASLNIPWADEAYSAHIGTVHIQSESFETLVRLIDDYLADDKLISSPYFTQIEGAISDAGFTLYVRPDKLADENPFIEQTLDWPGTNSLVFQAFSELPGQKFFTISMLHHKEIVDEAPIIWSALIDAPILSGPWPFQNHYTKENEVLVQDDNLNLYLINKDGRTLWKKKLSAPIVGEIQQIDLFDNGKYQLLLATQAAIHVIDRNGNPVKGFPIDLSDSTAAAPTLIRYDGSKDVRILFSDGIKLVNVDEEGNPVKGWTEPKLDAGLKKAVRYLNFRGKDYLMAWTSVGKVHFLDRRGAPRMKAIQLDSGQHMVYFEEGRDLNSCRFTGHDHSGNVFDRTIGGKVSKENILPLGKAVGMIQTGIDAHDLVTVSEDHLVTLDRSRNVGLDYLLPEAVEPEMTLLSKDRMWVGLNAAEGERYYIIDLDGHMLDKMPVLGRGKAIVMDITGNGSLELIISNGKRELKAYSLAD